MGTAPLYYTIRPLIRPLKIKKPRKSLIYRV